MLQLSLNIRWYMCVPGKREVDLHSYQWQAGGFGVRLQQQQQFSGLVHCQEPADRHPSGDRLHHYAPLTGNDTHPRWQPEDCSGVRPTLVRLLSKAVGMTGMALTGWTSRWTDGQTKDQLRLKEAESAC